MEKIKGPHWPLRLPRAGPSNASDAVVLICCVTQFINFMLQHCLGLSKVAFGHNTPLKATYVIISIKIYHLLMCFSCDLMYLIRIQFYTK